MRKPRLNERTIQKLYDEGKAYSGKYEYELVNEYNEELNTYVDYLYRWDEDGNYEKWGVPAWGIWTFNK